MMGAKITINWITNLDNSKRHILVLVAFGENRCSQEDNLDDSTLSDSRLAQALHGSATEKSTG